MTQNLMDIDLKFRKNGLKFYDLKWDLRLGGRYSVQLLDQQQALKNGGYLATDELRNYLGFMASQLLPIRIQCVPVQQVWAISIDLRPAAICLRLLMVSPTRNHFKSVKSVSIRLFVEQNCVKNSLSLSVLHGCILAPSFPVMYSTAAPSFGYLESAHAHLSITCRAQHVFLQAWEKVISWVSNQARPGLGPDISYQRKGTGLVL